MLESLVEQLRAVAERHNCRLVSELPGGASGEKIGRLEQFVGAQLPNSLKRFLQMHDGMALHFYANADTDRFPLACYELLVFGTTDIITRTEDFRAYIDVESELLRSQMSRCFDFANVAGIDERLIFWLDAPRPGGEYAILTADLAVDSWLDDLESLSRIEIASSFDEFLERSLRFMLEKEAGFWYWWPRATMPEALLW